MIQPLSSFTRIIQMGFNQLVYRRDDPDPEPADDDWKHPGKKPSPYVPQPPAEGCPINSLPPEILTWIFVLGQQMEDDPEPSHAADTESDSGDEHEHGDSAHVCDDPVMHIPLGDRDVDTVPPPEPIPVVDDDQNNSDWEDEDSDGGSGDDLSVQTFLLDESFQVTVSHVCRHWRAIALDSPPLWSEIDVETGRHAGSSYRRASTYLSRTKEYPLSISIDVNEPDSDTDSVSSEQSDSQSLSPSLQLKQIIDLLLPHTRRWLKFRLAADSYHHFFTVLSRFCTAPPASLLEHLELHHLDEELEPEPLFFPYPSEKTPFVIFGNCAPKLRHVSLYSVHIDWHNTTFLKNLHSLELAYLPQDVRPSFDEFFTILRSSPELRTLDLCMSGPSGHPHEWPAFLPPPPQDDHYHDPHVPAAFATQPGTLDEYMVLPRLHELKLSYQSPEDLAAFFSRVSMPSLHNLEVNLEDHEYTEFIQSYFIAPPKWQGGSSRESRLANLKEFSIIQLPCTPKVIAELYAVLGHLEAMNFDFNTLDEPFWKVLVPGMVSGVTTPAKQLLPSLRVMKVKGSSGEVLRQIVGARMEVELPLKKLFIDLKSDVEKEDDSWLRENVEEVEYFEASDEDDYTDDDESEGGIIEMDGFHL
jgi:hypothetical protein